jgi:RHS repeat-associated protein
VTLDRVGSVRNAANIGASRYFPYGEEETTTPTPQDRDKFGTYYRDGTTGLDYAQNRYYASTLGRFITPDPGNAGDLSNPQSLNHYSYVLDDPINHYDPQGLCDVLIGGITQSQSVVARQWAQDNGAISAFPYAGGTHVSDVLQVITQGAGIPTGETLTALAAIALAAQNPGPIDIVAFSGGAQAFTTAFGMLTTAVQSRINSITYIDPGGGGGLTAGNSNTSVTVLGESSDVANQLVQITAGSPTNPQPPNATYIDTGNCGHNLDCVLERYSDFAATGGAPCQIGAGGVFGVAPRFAYQPVTPIGLSGMQGYWYQVEPVPSVKSTISFDLP